MLCPAPCLDPQIRLRPARDEDGDFLLRVHASTREAERALGGWTDEAWIEFIAEQQARQQAGYLAQCARPAFNLILLGDEPVGRFYRDDGKQEIRLLDLALLPGHRGLGIGTCLIRDVLAEAQATKRCVGLHVGITNPALALYLRLGLRVVDVLGPYLYLRSQAGAQPEGQPG
ncbi:MAG: GNAT family N-acetyltransferase [Candidatus Dactylopiibacterium carminicum]|nr:MAG: GNAT family N-acetyltransferase [Candidatus Dactylopiibacterium carminicum]